MEIRSELETEIFGVKLNSLTVIGINAFIVIFLMFLWPFISGSFVLVPLIVVLVPYLCALHVYDDIFKSKKLFKILFYSILFLTTIIYTYFFLDLTLIMRLMHYLVYFGSGYSFVRFTDLSGASKFR